VVGHIGHGEVFARVNPQRRSVNLCRGLLDVPGKAKIDHPAERNPVVRSYAGSDNDKKKPSPKQNEAKAG
jgi:hypothetical protein